MKIVKNSVKTDKKISLKTSKYQEIFSTDTYNRLFGDYKKLINQNIITPKQIIREEIKKNIEFSKSKEQKNKDFLIPLQVLNHRSGEIFKLSYDLKTEYKNTYNDLIQRSIHIQEKAEKLEYVGLFLTFTNTTEFHQFTDKGKSFNKRYKGFTINESYQNLNNLFRNIMKEISKNDNNRKTIEKMYIKVFEKHKSLQPHLHSLVFIHPNDLERFLKILQNKMGCKDNNIKRIITPENNKYQFNFDLRKNKGNLKSGRCEVEILRDMKKGVGYISKYIKKQFITDNNEEMYELDGWKRRNGIRLITTSKIEIPKFIYNKINKFVELEHKTENKNCLSYIIKNTKLDYLITYEGKSKDKELKSVLECSNPIYKVLVEKKKRYTTVEENNVISNELWVLKQIEGDNLVNINYLSNMAYFSDFMKKTNNHILNDIWMSSSPLKQFNDSYDCLIDNSKFFTKTSENNHNYIKDRYISFLEEIQKKECITEITEIIIYKNDLEIYKKSDNELLFDMKLKMKKESENDFQKVNEHNLIRVVF